MRLRAGVIGSSCDCLRHSPAAGVPTPRAHNCGCSLQIWNGYAKLPRQNARSGLSQGNATLQRRCDGDRSAALQQIRTLVKAAACTKAAQIKKANTQATWRVLCTGPLLAWLEFVAIATLRPLHLQRRRLIDMP